MKRRGQTQFLSIGVIFSIIIIIAILGISAYVIIKFVNIGDCADFTLFKQNFQDEIDRAWSSEIVRDTFTGKVSRGIESVCIGKGIGTGAEYAELAPYQKYGKNMFFYPESGTCGNPEATLEHVDITFDWACFPVINGKVRIGLEKGSFDDLVKITKPNAIDAKE